MCLILLALDAHARYPLVFAANRDESFARPAAPAGWWAERPHVLAGRDLVAGGTWMGVARNAEGWRWAAVTNVRDLSRLRDDARSRGELVADYLARDVAPPVAAASAYAAGDSYNPFNLLCGHGHEAWYTSTHRPGPAALSPGVHGLSNATLDVPWPKVAGGVKELRDLLAAEDLREDDLLRILDDRRTAPDADLPETGVGLEYERGLSSRFIVMEGYGTRSSTVLLLDRAGGGRFVERTFGPGGVPEGEVGFEL